jgi:hypothetical protein
MPPANRNSNWSRPSKEQVHIPKSDPAIKDHEASSHRQCQNSVPAVDVPQNEGGRQDAHYLYYDKIGLAGQVQYERIDFPADIGLDQQISQDAIRYLEYYQGSQ